MTTDVDVDGVVPGPQHPLSNPKKPALKDQGFDQAFDVPDGEARDAGEALIGDPGVLAEHICFGKDGI
jgi:hypothetical protein